MRYVFQYTDKMLCFFILMQQERAERERELDYQPRKVNRYLFILRVSLLFLCTPGVSHDITLQCNIRSHNKHFFCSYCSVIGYCLP